MVLETDFISVRDASKVLDISTQALTELIQRGKIKAIRATTGYRPHWKIYHLAFEEYASTYKLSKTKRTGKAV